MTINLMLWWLMYNNQFFVLFFLNTLGTET